MEFREVAPGRLWPPIIPEGTAYGCSEVAPGKVVELFEVKPEGIFCAGINYAWGDLGAISVIDDTLWIHSKKYSSGGLRFKEHPFYLVDPFGERFDYIHGYRAAWCLLNRITYEQQLAKTGKNVLV